MLIGIIGSGNVASVLARSFMTAGDSILYIYSRNKITGAKLAKSVKAPFIHDPDSIPDTAALHIIAAGDSGITDIASQVGHLKQTVVHTSGATPLSVLKEFKKYGVFYPVNSISATDKKIEFGTYFCIETSSAAVTKQLQLCARNLDCNSVLINSKQRLALHTAAVFSNNFVNALLQAAYEIVKGHDVSFEILKPLLQTTIMKAMKHEPVQVQTGPAVRNDEVTLNKHLQLLQGHEDLQKIYYDLTALILLQQEKHK